MSSLLSQSDLEQNDLLYQIGLAVTGKTLAAQPDEEKDIYISAGKAWFDKNMEKFRVALCGSEKLKSALNQESDEKNLIIAISDVLASIVIGVPPVMVASLIIKIGVNKFCS